MITTPTENTKLTLEQLQQLDVVETRLHNLTNETAIAMSSLNAVRNDCDRITKEKKYAQLQLDEINRQLTEAQNLLASTTASQVQLDSSIDIMKSDISTANEIHQSKLVFLNDKELTVNARDAAVTEKEIALRDSQERHDTEKQALSEKLASLQEIIKTI
jgi:uncharacterized protein (DUF3084 family)